MKTFETIEEVKEKCNSISENFVAISEKGYALNKYFDEIKWDKRHKYFAQVIGKYVNIFRNADSTHIGQFTL